jgi:hypothetical protein
MSDLDKRQLVLNEMAKDPNGKRGPRTIKEILALEQSVHLTRFVWYIGDPNSKN